MIAELMNVNLKFNQSPGKSRKTKKKTMKNKELPRRTQTKIITGTNGKKQEKNPEETGEDEKKRGKMGRNGKK